MLDAAGAAPGLMRAAGSCEKRHLSLLQTPVSRKAKHRMGLLAGFGVSAGAAALEAARPPPGAADAEPEAAACAEARSVSLMPL